MKKIYRGMLVVLLLVLGLLIYFAVEERDNNHIKPNTSVLAGDDIAEVKYTSKSSINISANSQDVENNGLDSATHMVIPSGQPVGIYVKTKGVMVINTSKVRDNSGNETSPCEGILMPGDYIVSINGTNIEDKNHLIETVQESGDKNLIIDFIRDGNKHTECVKAVKCQGRYMLGLWVKDDISGIGTLTYIDENGFAALGHSINDNDTGTVMSISDGALYDTTLINIIKSDGNKPGRLEGLIDYSRDNIIGRVNVNCEFGIRGYVTKNGMQKINNSEWIPVASKQEAYKGDAYLLSCITGKPEYYKVQIVDIDTSPEAGNKSLEIKVIDQRLLSITNGIVQGMSGTPIIQDGKLLGAITHVFVKDSTRGYGTFVEDMME